MVRGSHERDRSQRQGGGDYGGVLGNLAPLLRRRRLPVAPSACLLAEMLEGSPKSRTRFDVRADVVKPASAILRILPMLNAWEARCRPAWVCRMFWSTMRGRPVGLLGGCSYAEIDVMVAAPLRAALYVTRAFLPGRAPARHRHDRQRHVYRRVPAVGWSHRMHRRPVGHARISRSLERI